MKLLAIDTSSSACSIALQMDDEVKVLHELAPMQQAQKILPLIDTLLRESNISLNQLDALAFGCGPGSFTGVRIATSVMQGLGFALNIPLIPISSLAALAQAAYMDLGWEKLLVGVDARIQEVYWGVYAVNSEGLVELVGREIVSPPAGLPQPPFTPEQDQELCGVGNAWEVYKDQILFKPNKIDVTRLHMAKGLLPIAKIRYETQTWVTSEQAIPTYLRDEVAIKKS